MTLREQFEQETGNTVIVLYDESISCELIKAPSWKYIDWLESRCEKQEKFIAELRKVAETGILPDGDHVNIPTIMWLEEICGIEKE